MFWFDLKAVQISTFLLPQVRDIIAEIKKNVSRCISQTQLPSPFSCQGDKAQPSLAENIVLATLAFNTHWTEEAVT